MFIVFIDEHDNSYKDAQTHVFIIGTYIGIILEVIGPVLVFINDKYVSNQDAKNGVFIVKYFIVIIINVGG